MELSINTLSIISYSDTNLSIHESLLDYYFERCISEISLKPTPD